MKFTSLLSTVFGTLLFGSPAFADVGARVTLEIKNSNYGFWISVQNLANSESKISSATVSITGGNFDYIQTDGSFTVSPSAVTADDSQNSPSATLTFPSGLNAGSGKWTAGDIDPSSLTGGNVSVTFQNGSVVSGSMTYDGTMWVFQKSQASSPPPSPPSPPSPPPPPPPSGVSEARVTLEIKNSNYGFWLSVQNLPTSQSKISSATVSITGGQFDYIQTDGSFSVAPSAVSADDSQSSASATLTFPSGLNAGSGKWTAGDIDPSSLTGGNVSVTFQNGAVVSGAMSYDGTKWVFQKSTSSGGTNPPAPPSPNPPPPPPPSGNVHVVPTSTSNYNCSSVSPGDTVVIAGPVRGPLQLTNCKGNSSNRITVRNDVTASSRLTIRKTDSSASGFVFTCYSCEHVNLDFTGGWAGAPSGGCGVNKVTLQEQTNRCGLLITQTSGVSPATYLMINGTSQNITIKGIEVDGVSRLAGGSSGVGIQVNEHYMGDGGTSGPYRENIVVQNNYIHDVPSSGTYVGPNWQQVINSNDRRLRNIEQSYNIVEDVDNRCLTTKSAVQGVNTIHHNVCRRTGYQVNGLVLGHGHGLMFSDGGGSMYGNLVVDAGEHGIEFYNLKVPSSYGPFDAIAYNNMVINAGASSVGLNGRGIDVGRAGTAYADYKVTIYNNTVVNSALTSGIGANSQVQQSGTIRDNIVAHTSGGSISAPSNVSKVNNRLGTVSGMGFINPNALNFCINSSSPARDAGSTSGYPSTDFNGVSRPQGPKADQGACEYVP